MTDRVYDAAQVDEYVASLHEQLDRLRADLAATRAPVAESSEAVERALGRALLHVQRMADDAEAEAAARRQALLDEADATLVAARRERDTLVETARREADEILARATAEARAAIADARARVDDRAAEWSAADTLVTDGTRDLQLAGFSWREVTGDDLLIDLTDRLVDAPPPTGPPIIALDGDPR